MTTQQPEALRLAGLLELAPEEGVEPQTTEEAAAELRRQHTRIAELEAQLESIEASAGSEPVAWRIDWPDEPELGHYFSEAPTDSGRCQPLYTHPSPPEGMVGGWMPLIEAPNNEIVLVAGAFGGPGDWRIKCGYLDGQTAKWRVFGASWEPAHWEPTHWMPLPPPPTTPAGSGKGE